MAGSRGGCHSDTSLDPLMPSTPRSIAPLLNSHGAIGARRPSCRVVVCHGRVWENPIFSRGAHAGLIL